MHEFWMYTQIGFDHIANLSGMDHILFVAALCIRYQLSDWKKWLILVTAFTIGHSVTLVLSVFNYLDFATNWIEFLIPVTICTTGFFNILKTSSPTDRKQKILLFFALFFGLIHGLGFSNYFRLLIGKEDDKILPLIEFAIGIEAAQIIIVLGILFLGLILQTFFKVSKRDWVLVGSSVVIGIAFPMIIDRIFW